MAKEIVTPYGTFQLQREDKTKFITVYKSPEGNYHFKLRNERVKPGDFITTEHTTLSAAVGSPYKHIGCVRLGAYDLEGKLVTKANDRYDGDDAVKNATIPSYLRARNITDTLNEQQAAKDNPGTDRFTRKQYHNAIKHLLDAMEQLEPDGRCCTCCGDDGHQAFECGFNPLVAMAICVGLAKDAREYHDKMHAGTMDELKALSTTNRLQADSDKLHELTHYLGGFDSYMGSMLGPAKVRLPS